MFKPKALKTCLEKTLNNGVTLSFISGDDGRLVAFAGNKEQASLLCALMEFNNSVYSKTDRLKSIAFETKDKKIVVGISVHEFMICFVGSDGATGQLISDQVTSLIGRIFRKRISARTYKAQYCLNLSVREEQVSLLQACLTQSMDLYCLRSSVIPCVSFLHLVSTRFGAFSQYLAVTFRTILGTMNMNNKMPHMSISV